MVLRPIEAAALFLTGRCLYVLQFSDAGLFCIFLMMIFIFGWVVANAYICKVDRENKELSYTLDGCLKTVI